MYSIIIKSLRMSEIMTNGVRSDKSFINNFFKNEDASKKSILDSITDNQFLYNVVKSSKDSTKQESIIESLENAYKNLKKYKKDITDISDEKLYITMEGTKTDEELLLIEIFDNNKITSKEKLETLIREDTSLPERKHTALLKKVNLYPHELNNDAKDGLLKFLKKEYKLYSVDGITPTKLKKIMLTDHLNVSHTKLLEKYKSITKKSKYTNEQRIKEFVTVSKAPDVKTNVSYKELKTSIVKGLTPTIKSTMNSENMVDFLRLKLKMSDIAIQSYLDIEKVINPDLQRSDSLELSEEEFLKNMNFDEESEELLNKYYSYLCRKESSRAEKAIKAGFEREDVNITKLLAMAKILTYEKFIIDADACAILSNFVNYVILDMLKSSIDNIIAKNANTNSPKKIVMVGNLVNDNNSVFSIFYKNTKTFKSISGKNDSTDADSDVESDTETVDDDVSHLRYKTSISHVKELLACDKVYGTFKFNKELIITCTHIINDLVLKLVNFIRAYFMTDFSKAKFVQKKVLPSDVKAILNIILINNDIGDIEEIFNTIQNEDFITKIQDRTF